MTRAIIKGLKHKRESSGFDVDRLSQIIEEAYVRVGKSGHPDGFKTKKTFAPSSIAYGHGTCPRYWYLAFSGAEFVDSTLR